MTKFPRNDVATWGCRNYINHSEVIHTALAGLPPYSYWRPAALIGDSPESDAHLSFLDGFVLATRVDCAFDTPAIYVLGLSPITPPVCRYLQAQKQRSAHLRLLAAESCLPPEDANLITVESAAHHDYILSPERIVAAPTASLKAKQKARRRFHRRSPDARFVCLDLRDPAATNLARSFIDRAQVEDALTSQSKGDDAARFRRCLDMARHLQLECHAVMLGDEIVALQASEMPSGDCCFAHFFRHRRNLAGLHDYFDTQFAELARARGFRYYNIAEDLGLANIRAGKQRWDPVKLLRMYEIILPVRDSAS